MVQRTTEYFSIKFYDSYVILKAHSDVIINRQVSEEVLNIIFDFYRGKDFVLIANRENFHTVETEAYSPKLIKKLKGIAIVSPDPVERERAMNEQLLFKQSFAFFSKLKEARVWAEAFASARM